MACLLIAAVVVNGQGTASRVTGLVVDESGAVIAGAQVTLTNEATQATLTTETSDGGTYVFDSVQVGSTRSPSKSRVSRNPFQREFREHQSTGNGEFHSFKWVEWPR